MLEPVLELETVSMPPIGSRIASGFGLWVSVHPVPSPNVANTAAKQLSLSKRICPPPSVLSVGERSLRACLGHSVVDEQVPIALDPIRVPLRNEAQFVHQAALRPPAQALHSCTRDTVAAIVEGAVFHKHDLLVAILPENVAHHLSDLEVRIFFLGSHVVDLAHYAFVD